MDLCVCGHIKDEHELGIHLCLVDECSCGEFHESPKVRLIVSHEEIYDVNGNFIGSVRRETLDQED